MMRAAARLLLVLLVGTSTLALAQPTGPRPHPPTPVRVVFPDTMKVSVREPVSVRLEGNGAPVPVKLAEPQVPLTVKLDEPRPPIDPEVFAALIGVLLGALTGEGVRWWRDRRRIGRLKRALKDECRSLLSQVPDFIDICQKMIASLKRQRVLPGPTVKGIRTIYEANIAELAPHLTLLERNLLHAVHEGMRVGEELLAAQLDDVREEVRSGHVADPWSGWIARLTDLIDRYRLNERLLRSYLAGKPVDVFYVEAGNAGTSTTGTPSSGPSPGAATAIVPPTFEVVRNFMRIVGRARQALHGIDAKIGNTGAFGVVGPRGLRPDLQSLQAAIEEFKTTEARVVELRTPAIERKLSDAFVRVERQYQQADRVVAPYERPDVAPGAAAGNQEFPRLAESVRSDVALLDAVTKELEKLTG